MRNLDYVGPHAGPIMHVNTRKCNEIVALN